ncbi:DUF2177 family protein [Paracholeplasma manati]|jgi:uncharacterized membrane protein|uniref:DUF2177 family protein n=1 Tax=Paracholeplasma manati TaxID=591373 RepID=UPI0024085D01|nr:DUF2177 family protein [Paracholeplasma manati]MDG0889432.1 DUF2177 family protein [Paracholeplasma manati]MDX9807724.1 DUF2177 family protein [Acholeplasma sp.]
MLPILKLYGIAFVVFFVVDLIWLGLVAKDLYQKEIGSLLKPDVNWAAAIIFYLLFILGLVIFVINPSVESGSLAKAMMLGAFFGLVTYATYDLTNLATMRDFTLKITLIDLTWGTTLGFLTSTLTYLINDWLF